MNAEHFDYVGDELELFSIAKNWKSYVRNALSQYLCGNIAEVGAGIGSTSMMLSDVAGVSSWICIEPDAEQAAKIKERQLAGLLPTHCSVLVGKLGDLPIDRQFDTIIYIDVLEHIEADRAELERALQHLKQGGRIVVLSPAWQALYSEFDKQIGHYRRYRIRTLRALAPAGALEINSFYLDSVGMLASLANRFLLGQGSPKRSQLLTWDRLMVPISRMIDPLCGRRLGRSVVIIWEKT